jgi:hypothetical protein
MTESIGRVLGVSDVTIGRDLKDISTSCRNVRPDRGTDLAGVNCQATEQLKPAKTATDTDARGTP